jgi:aminocarboxymuconate-semialdehyde decarboxylase
MQDGEAAACELRRAVSELGLRGAAVCTQINGADLDADRFAPLFRAAEQLGVPLFLHPQNHGDLGRLQDYHLCNLVGFPFETALTAARLMLGGVFERHPGLQVILAHGGGFFPYQIGRLDHGWRTRPVLRRALPHPPSHYLTNVFCDSLVHDAGALRFLIERVGWDHVVLGCDYPFGMGSATPVEAVQALRLPAAQDAAILGGTLAGLLRVVPQAKPETP